MKTDIHTHRCGLHLTIAQGRNHEDPPLTLQGCGHEWEHERIFKSKEDYERRHCCPRCGAGPWYARVPLREQRDARLRTFIEAPRIDEAMLADATHAQLVLIAGSLLDALGFDEVRFDQGERIRRDFWKE